VGRRVLLCIFCCMIGEFREVHIYFSLFYLKIVLIPKRGNDEILYRMLYFAHVFITKAYFYF